MAKRKNPYSEGSRFKPFEGPSQKDKHVRITSFMLLHPSYKSLRSSSKELYTYMKLWASGKDEVTFAGSMVKDFMSKNTFTVAKNELIEKGFIDPLNLPGHMKQAGQYKFSNRWYIK